MTVILLDYHRHYHLHHYVLDHPLAWQALRHLLDQVLTVRQHLPAPTDSLPVLQNLTVTPPQCLMQASFTLTSSVPRTACHKAYHKIAINLSLSLAGWYPVMLHPLCIRACLKTRRLYGSSKDRARLALLEASLPSQVRCKLRRRAVMRR